jgi:hypothetical protein
MTDQRVEQSRGLEEEPCTGKPSDQRAEHRIDVEWFVRGGHPEGICVKGWTVNVSVPGMLIRVPIAYSIGQLVEFELWLGPLQSIRVVGLIVRRENYRHGFFCGVEFRGMPMTVRQELGDELLRIRRRQYNDQFAA